MSADKTETKDLKKLLGNPKITFVLGKCLSASKLTVSLLSVGGPASGKGT